MLSREHAAMFHRLAHTEPALKRWLESELDKDKSILTTMMDIHQLRVAQGSAQRLQGILTMIDKCGGKNPG